MKCKYCKKEITKEQVIQFDGCCGSKCEDTLIMVDIYFPMG